MPELSGEFMFMLVLSVPALVALVLGALWRVKTTLDASQAPVNYWGVYSNGTPVNPIRGVSLPEIPHEEIRSETHHHVVSVHP